jgi:hypothetical protein
MQFFNLSGYSGVPLIEAAWFVLQFDRGGVVGRLWGVAWALIINIKLKSLKGVSLKFRIAREVESASARKLWTSRCCSIQKIKQTDNFEDRAQSFYLTTEHSLLIGTEFKDTWY